VLTVLLALVGLWLGGVTAEVAGSALAALLVAAGEPCVLRRHFGLLMPPGLYARTALAALVTSGALWSVGHMGWGAAAGWAGGLTAAAVAGSLAYALALAALFPRCSRRLPVLIRALRRRRRVGGRSSDRG